MDLRFFPLFQPIELVKPLFIIFIAKIIVLNTKLIFIEDIYILF